MCYLCINVELGLDARVSVLLLVYMYEGCGKSHLTHLYCTLITQKPI